MVDFMEISQTSIPTIILCGGKGTRLREETEFKPKPMVEIGGKPILWHIMKIYAHYGFYDFVLALGYKGDSIRDYFLKQRYYESDFAVETGGPRKIEFLSNGKLEQEHGGKDPRDQPEDALYENPAVQPFKRVRPRARSGGAFSPSFRRRDAMYQS